MDITYRPLPRMTRLASILKPTVCDMNCILLPLLVPIDKEEEIRGEGKKKKERERFFLMQKSTDFKNETDLEESRSPGSVYTEFITYINCAYIHFVA